MPLAPSQRLRGLLVLRDILHRANHPHRLTSRVVHRAGAVVHDSVAAVSPAEAIFAIPELRPFRKRVLKAPDHLLAVVRMQPLPPPLERWHDPVARVAERRLGGEGPPRTVVPWIPVP